MSDDVSYIYDGVEVIRTGRTATKNFTNKMTRSQTSIELRLYEIQPLDVSTHGSWKKWVSLDDLFTIED